MTTDPETPTARDLLAAAFHETHTICQGKPGLDTYAIRHREDVIAFASTPSGAELLRRADEARVAEGLTVEALVEALVEAVVDALMSDETGDGYYRWQFDNIVRPAILANLPAPRSVVDPLLERWDREIAGHRQVDDVWNRGVADGMAICAADVRHIPAPRPPEPVAASQVQTATVAEGTAIGNSRPPEPDRTAYRDNPWVPLPPASDDPQAPVGWECYACEATLPWLGHTAYPANPMGPEHHIDGTGREGRCLWLVTREALNRPPEPDRTAALVNALVKNIQDALVHLEHEHYGWAIQSLDAALAAQPAAPHEPERFTGQMTWPCVCGHIKGAHYFGDALGADGQMHTWCQMNVIGGHCTDFRPAPEAEPERCAGCGLAAHPGIQPAAPEAEPERCAYILPSFTDPCRRPRESAVHDAVYGSKAHHSFTPEPR